MANPGTYPCWDLVANHLSNPEFGVILFIMCDGLASDALEMAQELDLLPEVLPLTVLNSAVLR